MEPNEQNYDRISQVADGKFLGEDVFPVSVIIVDHIGRPNPERVLGGNLR